MNRQQQKQTYKPTRMQIIQEKRFLNDQLTWTSNAEEKRKKHTISVQLATWEKQKPVNFITVNTTMKISVYLTGRVCGGRL